MRILLVNPPCGPRTIGMRNISRVEPLGLELIGAAVSGRHDVRLVDMLVCPSDLDAALRDFSPDVVGVTTETARMSSALAVLRRVRRAAPDCLTVVGGHHPTIYPSDFNDPAVDLVVLGEGVHPFAEICSARAEGASDFSHIPGLMVRTPDGLAATEPRELPTTLDDEPFPDRSLTARYRQHYFYMTEPSAAALRTNSGCENNCNFCPSRLYFRGHFVARDPKLVYEEIRTIDEPFILLCDNHSFHNPERMWALGKMLIDGGVKKRFFAYTRADAVAANPDLFELWSRAGLRIAMIGLEALDGNALCRMNKGLESSVNEQAVRIMERLGINVSAGFIIDPAATRADFRRINRYIKSRPSILFAEFTPLTPFPGTVHHSEAVANVVTRDWQQYDLQHFVVKTALPPKKLYRMMIRSYARVVFRVIWRLGLWKIQPKLRPHKIRLVRGLLANRTALRRAHRHSEVKDNTPAELSAK